MKVYLDYASTTPLLPEVRDAMIDIMENTPGNPSSIHSFGRKAKTVVEEARKIIAEILNCSLSEVFFTSGASESNNLVLRGAVADLGVNRIISSSIEHHCVLHTLDAIKKDHPELDIHLLPVDIEGTINYEELSALLDDKNKKTLVSIMHANNEIGTMHDIDLIANICAEKEALFHTDVAQSFGKYKFDLSSSNIDFLAIAAHKLYGPKGTGCVFIKNDHKIRPMLYGGSQERNMRAGTENVIGIHGLATAARLAYKELDFRMHTTEALRDYFENELLKKIEGLAVNGCKENRLYNVSNISFPKNDKSELLVFNLDIAGIAVSSASACSSGVESESHVLKAIKHNPERKAIRFSLSHLNTKEELNYCIDHLVKLCN